MDINYKILWFEDTEESYETLSRRTKRYVESKNLRCEITRIMGVSEFDISEYDLNSYEVLVVDLQLSHNSKGYEVIRTIRESNYVNDILFYSSAGVDILDQAMKENRLEGVFLSERDHRVFMEKIKQLIDKSVRRSENIINIRGIVMDETSEFDSQMKEIVLVAQSLMSPDEIKQIKEYCVELLQGKLDTAQKLCDKYPLTGEWEMSDLLAEHEFGSMMRARLVNRLLGQASNPSIQKVMEQCAGMLPEAFGGKKNTFRFAEVYSNSIIAFRNKLAHVKQLNAQNPVYIGKVQGIDYWCDTAFCTMIRSNLIRYGKWLDAVYANLERAT